MSEHFDDREYQRRLLKSPKSDYELMRDSRDNWRFFGLGMVVLLFAVVTGMRGCETPQFINFDTRTRLAASNPHPRWSSLTSRMERPRVGKSAGPKSDGPAENLPSQWNAAEHGRSAGPLFTDGGRS